MCDQSTRLASEFFGQSSPHSSWMLSIDWLLFSTLKPMNIRQVLLFNYNNERYSLLLQNFVINFYSKYFLFESDWLKSIT